MNDQPSVESTMVGSAALVVCRGALDLATSPELDEVLDGLTLTTDQLIVVDLREVEFMDSSGIGSLLAGHTRAGERGARFVLVPGSEQVRRVLELSGAVSRLTIVDSPDEVLPPG